MLDALEHLVDAELPSNLDTKTITLLIADCSKFEDDIFVKQSRKRIRQWLMEFSKYITTSLSIPLTDLVKENSNHRHRWRTTHYQMHGTLGLLPYLWRYVSLGFR